MIQVLLNLRCDGGTDWPLSTTLDILHVKAFHGSSCKESINRSAKHHGLNNLIWKCCGKSEIQQSCLLSRSTGINALNEGRRVNWDVALPCYYQAHVCMTGQRSHRQEERWKSTLRPNHYGNTWIDKQPRNDYSFFTVSFTDAFPRGPMITAKRLPLPESVDRHSAI